MGWMEAVGAVAARGGAEGGWLREAEGGASDEGGVASRCGKAADVRVAWRVVEGMPVEVEGSSVGAEESGGGGGGRGGDTAGERRDPSNAPPFALQAAGVA